MSTDVGRLLSRAWQAQVSADPTAVYDEVLREVSARAASEGSLGKADIGAIVLWKRITAQTPWARELLLRPDDAVRSATAEAYRLANDVALTVPEAGQAARLALRTLPGMGGTASLASAVLLALAPDRMAVWDRRVGVALEALRQRPRPGDGFYGRYLATAVSLAAEMDDSSGDGPYNPRAVDLALYFLGDSAELLAEARAVSA